MRRGVPAETVALSRPFPAPLRIAPGGIAAALAALMLAGAPGCSPDERRGANPALEPVSFADLPGWAADRHAEALVAFRRSCTRPMRYPAQAGADAERFGRAQDWRSVCAAAAHIADGDEAAARDFFERRFRPFRVVGKDGDTGLITGYYEPELAGARQRSDAYKVPLHTRPRDLVTVDLSEFGDGFDGERLAGRVEDGRLKPYYSRAQIVDGALAGQGLEIIWVADPIEAFFLQIQGSGRVRLPDGEILRLGYAATNGRPYTAIGRELVAEGALALETVSLQSIRAWLRANPERRRDILDRNRSYVFFRELRGEGPIGSQGVALTPGRSLAVDRRFLPLGVPLWIDTPDPLDPENPLRRLTVAQDTGGAIRGAVRADLFCGAGREAEERAGRMRSPGRYYVLLPLDPSRAAGV
ncbi:MAG: MltA domain-containing protein [Defluviicoccus sp.]|nr:MltA domain-containing protein [Defluviicoccus sp.]